VRLALHYILYIIAAYNAYAITMDNLRLLSSGIRLQSRFINTGLNAQYLPSYHLDRKSYSFRLVPKSSAEGPRDATGILYNCEVEIL